MAWPTAVPRPSEAAEDFSGGFRKGRNYWEPAVVLVLVGRGLEVVFVCTDSPVCR